MDFQHTEELEFQGESLWAGISSIEDPYATLGSDYYFDSYSHFGIHQDMIKDASRTLAYKNAILRNSYLFKDKIVLDLGCGTGILSFFAAKAGAHHVYGVDSADIINHAKKFVESNGFSNTITLIKGKIEDIELPVLKVDIIISEWMGFFLLFEGMLSSVLFARDKWLTPSGFLFPNKARIWLSAIEDSKFKSSKIDFWNDVYNIDMTPMRSCVLIEPIIDVIDSENILSTLSPIFECDLESMPASELSFISNFRLEITRTDKMHGMVGWFEVGFTHCHLPVTLSTNPKYKNTHWKHTLFYFDPVIDVQAGQILEGSIAVRPNPIHNRELDIKLSYNINAADVHGCQFYRLR